MTSQEAYVECSECGHPIERHDLTGCDSCPCRNRWTRAEIRATRKADGLPAAFQRWDF